MSDFTKGPWAKTRFGEIVGASGDIVRIEGFEPSRISSPETRANRDLAFAAPDLLEALEALAADYRRNGGLGFDLMSSSKMFAAIAKARGQS